MFGEGGNECVGPEVCRRRRREVRRNDPITLSDGRTRDVTFTIYGQSAVKLSRTLSRRAPHRSSRYRTGTFSFNSRVNIAKYFARIVSINSPGEIHAFRVEYKTLLSSPPSIPSPRPHFFRNISPPPRHTGYLTPYPFDHST